MALTTIDDRGLKTPIDLLDSEKIRFGTGNDLEIYHSGSHAFTQNSTGSLIFESGTTVLRSGSQENYIVATLNSDVELYYDGVNKIQTHPNGVLVNGNLYAVDNSKILLGGDADLEIYHDGSHSYIKDAGTGNLKVQSDSSIVTASTKVQFESAAEDEVLAVFYQNDRCELYYDNSKKFETTSTGVDVTGRVLADTISVGQSGDGRAFIFEKSDATAYSDSGTNAQFSIGNNNASAATNSVGIYLYTDGNGRGIVNLNACNNGTNSSADFKIQTRHNSTLATRVIVTSNGNLQIPNDTGKLELGTSQDLQIYHDGSHSYITDAGTGNLYISGHSGVSIDKYTGEEMANFNADADVELFFDNVKKFETEANGVQIFDHLGVGAASNTGSCVYIKTPEGSYGSNTTRRGLLVQESAWSDGNLIEAQGSLGATIFKVGGHPNDIEIPNDTSKLKLGESGDIEIYHDGTNNYLDAHNGTLYIRGSSNVIAIQAVDGENAIRSAPNAEVKLYYDGNEKVRTEDWGATIQDTLKVVATEGASAKIEVFADEGDDANDKWQLDATTGGEFFLRSWGAGGLNTAWYASYNATFGNPIFHGPIGGIDFSANHQATSTDVWNEYVYDGHLHRTAGQAYITIDDWLYIRDMSNDMNKRFQFNVNSGNAGAQNDWEDDQFDFAEMFEWSDGNPSGEDRIGNTVAVDGLTGKIKIAEDGDTVIGVVSGTAAFTANAGVMGWQGQYLRDEWGRYIYEDNPNVDGTPGKIFKVNPDFDPTKEYQTREERKEWDKIGIIGQCYVRKTAVKPSSWIKLKEVDSTKDFYLIK